MNCQFSKRLEYEGIKTGGRQCALNNPDFKPLECERFKNEAGSNYFVLSASDGEGLR